MEPPRRTAAHNAWVGQAGETIAAAHLIDTGFTILDRNWRCDLGELDIVALDGDTLVAVEVKTRTSAALGVPVAQITRAKLARLRRLAVRWLQEHRGTAPAPLAGVRVDVIGVLAAGDGPVEVDHRQAVG